MTATVHIDAGTVTATDPFPVAEWDSGIWDAEASAWGGTFPSWEEISCRVMEVECYRGRDGALDVVQPGTASIHVANPDGWATWRPDAPETLRPGSWLRIRVVDDEAGEQVLWTGQIRKIADSYDPLAMLTAEIVAVDPLARLGIVDLPARPLVGEGQTAAERIGLCLDEVFWPEDARDLDPGGPTLSAVNLEGRMIDHAQKAAMAAGGSLFASRDGWMVYRDSEWLRTADRSTDVQGVLATDGRPGSYCPTGIEVNGPDLDRVYNVVTVGGEKPTPEADPLEVIEVDQTSVGQYGASSWTMTGLPLTDVDQLTVLARRTLGLRAQPKPMVDAVTLSPIADATVYPFLATVDLGDLCEVHFTHPVFGWSWNIEAHVYGIRHSMRPSGVNNEAAEWTTTLTMVDATYFAEADVWDYARWDTARWAAPV